MIQSAHYIIGQRQLLECVIIRKYSRKYHEMNLNFNDGLDTHTSLISMGATFPHCSLVEMDHVIQTVRCRNWRHWHVGYGRDWRGGEEREEGWWGGLMDGRMDGWRKEGEKEPV